MSGASAIFAEAPEERPFWPPRNWWLVLLVILALAGALRYPGYDFSLPLVERVGDPTRTPFADEAFFSLAARMILDQGSAKDLHYHNYPPGIIALNYLALRFLHDEADPPTIALRGLRLLSVAASLVTVVVIALLGYRLAGEPGGWFSAGLWATSPAMASFSRFATPEIYVSLFTLLALYLALTGALYRRYSYTTASTYTLMLAIVFKYQAVLIAPLVLFVPFLNGFTTRRVVLGNLGRFALFSAWLLLLTPVLEAIQTTPEEYEVINAWVQHVDLRAFPTPEQLLRPWRIVWAEVSVLPLVPGWLGLLLLIRKTRLREWLPILILILSVALWFLVLGIFNEPALRFALPAVCIAILLAGAGYALWWHSLRQRSAPFTPVQRRWVMAAALLALVVLNLPNSSRALQEAQEFALPDRRNDLARWADLTLPPSSYLTESENHRTLNRDWGGYPGVTPFQAAGGVYDDVSIEQWRAQGVRFAIVPFTQYRLWREDGVHPYFTETTLLKSYSPSDAHRGPAMVVLLLQPIPHPATGQLGPIRLIGYELSEANVGPGDSFPFHLYWQATAATEADYQVFNHLLDADGNLVAQADGPPLPDPLLRRGTKDWDDPEEIIYSREYVLTLPGDLASGGYTLVTGFYRRDTGQRLLSPTGEDALWVARIAVE